MFVDISLIAYNLQSAVYMHARVYTIQVYKHQVRRQTHEHMATPVL